MFKVNEYFGGKVVSLGFQTETLPATVGVMAPGEHEFCPDKKETLTVISGALTVKLPDQNAWQTFKPGESFEVSPHRAFQLQVAVDTAYLCTYE
ncbi:pyrimidine/purine nucleoside phosphorylase [Porticoccus hydrocarbonoclasticus]|jgi:purine/pyrimidine-nucleoside phosphorylase|uniref:pyrimidine/purine nucleoside phosphorylase n=1 Tax=Porticoccus hydrocarbonoclasticus TaxID=1073414 RepID=UPI0023563F2C|nr:pyrimidine/purine nucleoside phosphorylase [Porticoccus hydrocarbonoclasticus]|tara:strand:- start:1558 stop:1839 length:282 start_codon:yes stop_codon:yes gene_type:complete